MAIKRKKFGKYGYLPVADLKKNREGMLEKEHIDKGVKLDPWKCAYANAENARPKVLAAHFLHTTAWLVMRVKGVLTGVRGIGSASIQENIKRFDDGKKILPGPYTIYSPKKGQRLGDVPWGGGDGRKHGESGPNGKKGKGCKRGIVYADVSPKARSLEQ